MARKSFQEQLLPGLKRIMRPHMEAEIKHLSLPTDIRLRREAEYWWQKMQGVIKQNKREVR